MRASERSVLHVLPHPGGGGETYVDLLDRRCPAIASAGSISHLARRRLAPAARARRRRRAPRGPRHDLLHVHGEVAGGLCLPLLATRPSSSRCTASTSLRRSSGFRRRAAVLNLRAVLRAADRTICVAETEHDDLDGAVGPRAARRAVVVRNGVRVPARRARPSEPRCARSSGSPTRSRSGSGSARSTSARIRSRRFAPRSAPRSRCSSSATARSGHRSSGPRASRSASSAIASDVPRLLAAGDLFVLTSRREGLSLLAPRGDGARASRGRDRPARERRGDRRRGRRLAATKTSLVAAAPPARRERARARRPRRARAASASPSSSAPTR